MFFNSEEKLSSLFLFFACLFVTCLLISNIIAGKLVQFRGIVLPAAVILFPLTYVFGDILTEVYGFRRARLVIWIGFIANPAHGGRVRRDDRPAAPRLLE